MRIIIAVAHNYLFKAITVFTRSGESCDGSEPSTRLEHGGRSVHGGPPEHDGPPEQHDGQRAECTQREQAPS